ncbi:hypothetical protein C0995_001018 [Termitomyces sp. Mi166|nr:hypothetical protein C0995_001018 [Termitomyces sp. Mi166\
MLSNKGEGGPKLKLLRCRVKGVQERVVQKAGRTRDDEDHREGGGGKEAGRDNGGVEGSSGGKGAKKKRDAIHEEVVNKGAVEDKGEIYERYHRARYDYSQAIKDVKKKHWDNWLELVDAQSVWDAKNFVIAPLTNRGKVRTPALKERVDDRVRKVEDNREKARLLHKAFFYGAPEDVGVPKNYEYLEPAFKWMPITDKETYKAVAKPEATQSTRAQQNLKSHVEEDQIHSGPTPEANIQSNV